MLSASFCVHVFCLSVNPRAHLRNHQIFAHVALVALQYVVYFRFRGRCHVFIQTVDKAAQQNGTHTQRDLTGAEWIWQRSIHFKRTISASSVWPLRANMTSFTNIDPKNWRNPDMWLLRYVCGQTDRQTDRHVHYPRESFREGLCNHQRWFVYIYTVSQKKQDTKLLPITFPKVNRFSKFFHWQTHW